MKTALLEKTVENTIEKLQKLNANEALVSELEWCLGSYRYDQNPAGLIEKSQTAYELLKTKKEENSRAVSQKLLQDLEKITLN
ncbi:hypothetical protein [Pleomorphovibrio marinus]|uniref:hypothetical protein n=1 Tax=Pleomorphovibrio marinus TaxID=2164132 RepID=UPI000E0BCB99|nr:hypothetical protein [Pleomorphovibrio marinus]